MPSIHDPSFALPPKPPYRWGTSPYRTRGGLYREEIAFSERVLGGSVSDLLKRGGDAELEGFFGKRFSSFDWYDVVPLLYLGGAVARARGVPYTQHLRELAIDHAEQALGGFSSIILRVVSNEAIAVWLPRASSWYHDFGGAEAKAVSPRRVHGVRSGIPRVFVYPWAVSAMHFTEHVLLKAGAKEPRASTLSADPDGERDGQPLFRVGFDVTWSG